MAIVKSYLFKTLILLSIIGNAIVLSMDRYPIDEKTHILLGDLNLAFFSFFALEIVIKLSGYGFKFYFKDKFNWFDSAVVLVSAVDEVLKYTDESKFPIVKNYR